MKKTITLALSALVLASGASIASADEPAFPHVLNAGELQKMFGERETIVDSTAPTGHLKYEVKTDGKVFGHNLSLIGAAASLNGQSSGTWRIDAAGGKVCWEWSNSRWQNACYVIVQTAANTYLFSATGEPTGSPFTVAPK